ncbi:MAG: HD domain-containing protein [Synergistaceae bacterium]|nr:HD domain-containing protein [Synergistaceae bacterium]
MGVLVASRSLLSAEALLGFLEAEGIAGQAWEVGTEAPKPEAGRWEAVLLDLRTPWPVKARFLPAGPRLAVVDPANEALSTLARERGARRLLHAPVQTELAEAVRGLAEKTAETLVGLPEMFLQADQPISLFHPIYGLESCNPAFCRWMKTRREELEGLDLMSLFGQEEARSLSGLFKGLILGEREPESREIRFSLAGATKSPAEATFSAVFRDDLDRARILATLKPGGKTAPYEKRLEVQARELAALQSMNLALNETWHPKSTLKLLVSLLRSHDEVDAAAVYLLDEGTMKLEFAEGDGFRESAIRSHSLKPGEGPAGAAALQRKAVLLADLDNPGEIRVAPFLLNHEGFRAACAAPLLASNRLLGVLEAYRRKRVDDPETWKERIETVARQASSALHRGFLVEELERANLELNLAYDSTIEGWSRALDLKCREPEWHTQRIAELTVRLAGRLGVTGKDLQAIRRGAILHDIGKMGIPDAILTKPGPLTEEKWRIMRLHPVYALHMLQPIGFLKDSIAIPHSHHERWDGQGYPRGLKGEEIPFFARIFSVVDVWVSLTADQPYRRAWTPDRALAYIREGAGRLFDPTVAKAFLEMIEPLNGNGS